MLQDRNRTEEFKDDIEESNLELEQVPGSLLKRIASSKKHMVEFFVEEFGFYLPPQRDLTAAFCR